MTVTFTDTNFEQEVLNSSLPVIVDFWAPWCGPCQMQGPIIDELATELEGKINVGKINVDGNPQTAEKYGIMSIPTIMVFKNGEIAHELHGVQSREVLNEKLRNLGVS